MVTRLRRVMHAGSGPKSLGRRPARLDDCPLQVAARDLHHAGGSDLASVPPQAGKRHVTANLHGACPRGILPPIIAISAGEIEVLWGLCPSHFDGVLDQAG